MANKPKEEEKERKLPEGLNRALVNRPVGADSRQLLSSLIRQWGGVDAISVDIFKEFRNAPSGGMVRQRIMEMLQRLVVSNTEHEMTNVVRPTDMSTEELHRYAAAYVARLAASEEVHKKIERREATEAAEAEEVVIEAKEVVIEDVPEEEIEDYTEQFLARQEIPPIRIERRSKAKKEPKVKPGSPTPGMSLSEFINGD